MYYVTAPLLMAESLIKEHFELEEDFSYSKVTVESTKLSVRVPPELQTLGISSFCNDITIKMVHSIWGTLTFLLM